MSVYIRLIRNNIKSSSSYGKYFAKAVSQGEVTLDEIAAEACRNSGFSEGAVIGVVTELQDILKEKLQEVYDELGLTGRAKATDLPNFISCTKGHTKTGDNYRID